MASRSNAVGGTPRKASSPHSERWARRGPPHWLMRQGVGREGGSYLQVGDFRPGLLGVSLSHLALVCGKCSQNLLLLLLGHLEEVKRSAKFSRDFVELGGRDLQFAMGFFQAKRSTARFRGCILLRAAGNVADPQGAH